MEHEDTKSCKETLETNTRNGRVHMKQPWTLWNEMEELGRNKTEEGHKVFFSGKEEKHEHGVGFLIYKDIVNTVMECRPVSSRFITIRLRAVSFNITVVQTYAPTWDYDDSETEEFYDQNVIGQTPKKDILVVQGYWNAKVGKDPSAQMREESDFWGLPLFTILYWRTLLVITKHPPKWTTPQPDWLHSSEEALPIRNEHCQNTKFSRSTHWKWPRVDDDDLPPSSEKRWQAKTHKTQI